MSAFDDIAALVRARSGLALGPDKVYLVDSRLTGIAQRLGHKDYTGLASRLATDRALQDEVVEALTTNETLFFRDNKPFEHLRTSGLPRLHGERPAGRPLRVWSAAASTGQEAYSLAMMIAEMGPALQGRMVQIVGTDIARAALARAREGLYSQFEVQRGLPAKLLVKYFAKEANGWRVSRQIRDMVEFREWNLLAEPTGLGTFDIVLCRNVLIYFDVPTKTRVLNLLASRLAPGGLLYLGGAETINGLGSPFQAIAGQVSVFEVPSATREAPGASSLPLPRLPQGVRPVALT